MGDRLTGSQAPDHTLSMKSRSLSGLIGVGLLLFGVLDAFHGGCIPIWLIGNDNIQKQGGHSGIRKMSGDAPAHRAGAEDGYATNC